MKKIFMLALILATLVASQNINCVSTYFHIANLSNDEIKVEVHYYSNLNKRYMRVKSDIKPSDVAFLKSAGEANVKPSEIIVEKVLKPGFSVIDHESIFDIKNKKVIKTKTKSVVKDKDIYKVDYYAFVVMPSPSDPDNLILKQRVNTDAKMILEEHKGPATPIFYQDLSKGKGIKLWERK